MEIRVSGDEGLPFFVFMRMQGFALGQRRYLVVLEFRTSSTSRPVLDHRVLLNKSEESLLR
jgi:hypothetical protein